MRYLIFLTMLFLVLVLGCGGGGDNPINPINPISYNTNGLVYMPTISSKKLTYAIIKAPILLGGGDLWKDTDDTTYQKGSISKPLLNYEDAPTSLTVMEIVDTREQRYSVPVFEGTGVRGIYSFSENPADEGFWLHWSEMPLMVLPSTLPDVNGTWDAGTIYRYPEFPGPFFQASVNIEFTLTGKLNGIENITVPAGTYNALKVTYTGKVKETVTGLSIQGATATIWFAEGIGPVRAIGYAPLTCDAEIVLKSITN